MILKNKKNAAFTLAEVLITLAVIGIVAVLTIPGVVKNHQEKAWSTAQDLFSKKLEVAMKTMATNSTVAGYDSTESFVNELKKYIKINKVCTDDVTKCFADKVVWNAGDEPVEVTNSAVQYDDTKGDWAETVGIQLNNGVTALIAYNKQCDVDPFNNQEAITAKCVGVIYDVSGFKTPNTNGKDILANANISALGGNTGCVYTLSDGTCFAKILGTQNGGYTPIKPADHATIANKYGVTPSGYDDSDDYWLGAMEACGGPSKMPTKENLTTLAQELYNDTSITEEFKDGLTLDTEKAAPFLAQSPGSDWFYVWSREEADSPYYACDWGFISDFTDYDWYVRNDSHELAVCLGD